MRFSTVRIHGREQATIACHGNSLAPLDLLDSGLRGDLLVLIKRSLRSDQLHDLLAAAERLPSTRLVKAGSVPVVAPYRSPRKIWGIGLNYQDHAADLDAAPPEQPASFIKGDHTIIGPEEEIHLPSQSRRTTAEAELGLVLGKPTTAMPTPQALDSLFGVCAVLDQTAEDILALNPRYLTRSKNFPTFFSFGPEVVTLDEFLEEQTLAEVDIATVVDDKVIRRNVVGNMRFSPAELLSFHSQMMPFYPGDLLSTGTPGAGRLTPGGTAEARISGLATLRNPVAPAG